MAIEPQARARRESSQSVDRAGTILRALAVEGPLRLADLARLTGTERRVLQRLLASLEDAGIVQRDSGTLRYDLGITLAILGELAAERVDLARIAPPFVRRLLAATGNTALLLVRQGDLAVSAHVELPAGDRSVITFPVGRAIPLWRSAPKAILAHLAPAERARIVAQSDTDLDAELEQIAACGYAVGRAEVQSGVAAVGAPVFDAIGRPVAAVCVLGPLASWEPEDAAPSTLAVAAEVSRTLGYRTIPSFAGRT